jgi:RNA polymerase sigma factor (sigma-70 family)
VARIREGDDRAFELLFERYRGRITAFIRGMVHDHARAEDIAQEVFISALRRMRETDRSIAFRPWIYEIAKNACIDAHRRARRAQEVSYDNDEALGAADQGRLVSLGAVPDAVEARASLENLQSALGALSESHADILVLRELEGRSHEEIARELGLSGGAVRQLIHRARNSVRAGASVLIPPALVLRMLGAGGATATRLAETGAGADGAGIAAKVAVAAIVAGGVAGGVAIERDTDDRSGSVEAAQSRGSNGSGGSTPTALGLGGGDGGPGPSSSSGPGSGASSGPGGNSGPGGDSGPSGSSGPGGDDGSGGSGSREGSSGSSGSGSGDDFDAEIVVEEDSSGSGSSGSGISGSGSSGSDSLSSGSGSGSSGSGSSGSG